MKTSGVFLAGTLFAAPADSKRTNWSGNYTYSTDSLLVPNSVEELQQAIKSCNQMRALGTRHSFNGIADSHHHQVSLQHFDTMEIDAKARTVAVGAGVPYGKLAPYLESQGFALHNLASLPHISVAGACSTGTHGSGVKNGNLSTAVAALEFVDAEGNVRRVSKEHDGEAFNGAVVALGALGVITKVTLNLLPAFDVQQLVYQNLSFRHLEHHLDEIFSAGYSVSLFTDWQNHQATQVWIKSRVESREATQPLNEFFGAKLAKENLHPLAGHSAENCTEQRGIPGPWYERLPHFRMNFTPSSGAELQTEYFVPRERAYPALLAVEQLRDRVTPHLFITELRTIDTDHLWMSPCYQRASLAIHFTWKPEWPQVKQLLPLIEEKLAPFEPRPHWAKLFVMEPSRLQAQYAKLPDFRALLEQYDPNGKFRNEFVQKNLFRG